MAFPSSRRALALLGAVTTVTTALAAEPQTAGAILQELRNFRETGSVLYVAAHPDDENNRLLPYLARSEERRVGKECRL